MFAVGYTTSVKFTAKEIWKLPTTLALHKRWHYCAMRTFTPMQVLRSARIKFVLRFITTIFFAATRKLYGFQLLLVILWFSDVSLRKIIVASK